MGKCKACGAPIYFIRTKLGRLMPCDVKSEKATVNVTLSDGTLKAVVPHFATCPEASQFKKKS